MKAETFRSEFLPPQDFPPPPAVEPFPRLWGKELLCNVKKDSMRVSLKSSICLMLQSSGSKSGRQVGIALLGNLPRALLKNFPSPVLTPYLSGFQQLTLNEESRRRPFECV